MRATPTTREGVVVSPRVIEHVALARRARRLVREHLVRRAQRAAFRRADRRRAVGVGLIAIQPAAVIEAPAPGGGLNVYDLVEETVGAIQD